MDELEEYIIKSLKLRGFIFKNKQEIYGFTKKNITSKSFRGSNYELTTYYLYDSIQFLAAIEYDPVITYNSGQSKITKEIFYQILNN